MTAEQLVEIGNAWFACSVPECREFGLLLIDAGITLSTLADRVKILESEIEKSKRRTEMTAEQLQKYRDMAHDLLGTSKHSIGLAMNELCNEIERQRIIIDGQDDAITSMTAKLKKEK